MTDAERYVGWLEANVIAFELRAKRTDEPAELHGWVCGKAEAYKTALDAFTRWFHLPK